MNKSESEPLDPQAAPDTEQRGQQATRRPSMTPKPPTFDALDITQEDITKYSSDALDMLARLQGIRAIQLEVAKDQKEDFIKKYILHRKTQEWKEKHGIVTGENLHKTRGNSSEKPQ